MIKPFKKSNLKDDFEKPHHQSKQYKKVKERKTIKKMENILKSKDINKLMSFDDSY